MKPVRTSFTHRWRLGLALLALSAAVVGCAASDAEDEAKSGRTLRGTPVAVRGTECFKAESRDLLWRMDQVAVRDPEGGDARVLRPLDFDENRDGRIDDTAKDANGFTERDAIRGRNTWLVWGGGNEAFWGWLQERGYGITDFMILLDSRGRGSRFARTGLINQPGMQSSDERFLGLYLDAPKPDGSVWLRPPQKDEAGSYRYPYEADDRSGYGDRSDYDSEYGYSERPEEEHYDAWGREVKPAVSRPPRPESCRDLFTPWTTPEQRARDWPADKGPDPFAEYVPTVVRRRLARDGFDPSIYGYPSGIFGLRLWLNPDFFADTPDAARAREYWRERVELTGGRYYTDSTIAADPELVRPFRVSMSCGFCHIGPHPLNPPDDPENPEWENLSGIIGGQYWEAQPSLGNLLTRRDFLYHFLKSQAPGTVDTSLISTDHINNTNVINAVFDVPARLTRALAKPTEEQSPENRLLRSLEDPGETGNRRHFPMVLFPGEDSVGVFGALARVYLNIGVFSEQWNRVDNPVVGFTPQRPFSVATSRTNSVFWNVNEQYRVGYLAKFFTLGATKKVEKSTAPMRLVDARDRRKSGREELAAWSDADRRHGREVFLDNCAICHSSKQPEGFDLRFEDEAENGWDRAPAPGDHEIYTLPSHYQDWEAFRRSPALRDYRARIRKTSDPPGQTPYDGGIDTLDPFIEDNFLSNELRVPVTLVGTYSGRAMATNAMRGQVWDNFSSETFKNLPSVGDIAYYDPYLEREPDPQFGTNAVYDDGREKGGPGYFRPASLISVWATAPYFHNNTLGIYNHDPSVDGRLRAFEDGIRKLLWNAKRKPAPGSSGLHPGDLRLDAVSAPGHPGFDRDPGYIYRVPVDTYLRFTAGFIRPLIEGVLTGYLGPVGSSVVFWILSSGIWILLVVLLLIGVRRARARHVGAAALVLGVTLGVLLALTGAGGSSGGTELGALAMLVLGSTGLASAPPVALWAVVAGLIAVGLFLMLTSREWRLFTRSAFVVFTLIAAIAGLRVNAYLNGRSSGIHVGPIPRGTPVNLLMNIDPAKRDELPAALIALVRGIAEVEQRDLTGDDAYTAFREIAGPPLMRASKVPDFVLDRGHWFGEGLSDREKEALIAFLATL